MPLDLSLNLATVRMQWKLPQAVCTKNARRFRDAGLLHHLAPRRDAGKAVAHCGGRRLRQLPLPAHRREIEGQLWLCHWLCLWLFWDRPRLHSQYNYDEKGENKQNDRENWMVTKDHHRR